MDRGSIQISNILSPESTYFAFIEEKNDLTCVLDPDESNLPFNDALNEINHIIFIKRARRGC